MLMSWNFSQCFYYRPPVLNIFQSNTPKFHCLQWINNTVLSLKYHAFFNQAPGLKQKLLERYFFMIRTIRNLASNHKGLLTKSCMHIYSMYVCVRKRERERPLGWTLLLSCSCDVNYTSWLAHISHDGELEKRRGQRLCERRGQKNRTACLCFVFTKCSPSCKINIPKFSSPPPHPHTPHNTPTICAKPSLESVLHFCSCCWGQDTNLWSVVCGVWSPFVLNCIGADTYLMSASASYLKSSAAFLQLPTREEMGAARLFYFIISDHDTACLTHTLFTTSPPSLPVVSVCALTWK